MDYYGVNAVPQVYIDGLIDAGYNGPWEAWMLDRLAVPSPLEITLTGQMFDATHGEISAEIVNTSASAVSGKLHFVLIEDGLSYSGKIYNWVMRDFFPTDAAGELISVNAGMSLNRTEAFTLGAWQRRNLTCLVFVQNDASKEIYQAQRIFFELDEPELAVVSTTIDDSALGNGNGRLDVGETASLYFGIVNLNRATAVGLTCTLTSTDPLVTIVDGAAAWPDVAYGETQLNTGDPLVITISEDTPWGQEVAVSLALSAGTYGKTIAVAVPVGSPENPIGPDAHGYYAYEDCDDYPVSPVYSWVEIDPNLGGPGTLVNLADDQTLSFDLPFTFQYYGTDFTRVSICSNGWIGMGNLMGNTPDNTGIPDTDGPTSMMAILWDDLNPFAAGGGKIYQYSDAVNHRYIVEYNGVEHYDPDGLGEPETFQIILYDPAYYPTPTGDGEIVMQYAQVGDATSCTVGIENPAETMGIEYLFNNAPSAAATGLVAGRAIKYTTKSPSGASAPDLTQRPSARVQALPSLAVGRTDIHFDLPASGEVSLRIYGPDGSLVRTLLDGRMAAGPGVAAWDGRNDRGRDVPAGVYFYRLSGEGFEVSRKIVLE